MANKLTSFELGRDGPVISVILADGLEPNQREAALYHVSYDDQARTLTVTSVEKVGTRYAGVNGIDNELDRAAVVILDKVNATADLRRDAAPTEFTLYHVPTRGMLHDLSLAALEKSGVTTRDANQLATVLKQTSDAKQQVVWASHSRGASVFDAAVRSLDRRGIHLHHQSAVVYSGSSNNDLMREDLAQAGVPLIGKGFYGSPIDIVPQVIGRNTLNPGKLLGSVIDSPALFTDVSPHTWHPKLRASDYNAVQKYQWEKPGVDLRQSRSEVPHEHLKLLANNPASLIEVMSTLGKTAQIVLETVASATFDRVASPELNEGPSPAAPTESLPKPKHAAPMVPASGSRVFPAAPSVNRGLRN
jgi:hypothetical protein